MGWFSSFFWVVRLKLALRVSATLSSFKAIILFIQIFFIQKRFKQLKVYFPQLLRPILFFKGIEVTPQSNTVHHCHRLRLKFPLSPSTKHRFRFDYRAKSSPWRCYFRRIVYQRPPWEILINKNLLVAFLFVISGPFNDYVVHKGLIFRIFHTK